MSTRFFICQLECDEGNPTLSDDLLVFANAGSDALNEKITGLELTSIGLELWRMFTGHWPPIAESDNVGNCHFEIIKPPDEVLAIVVNAVDAGQALATFRRSPRVDMEGMAFENLKAKQVAMPSTVAILLKPRRSPI